MKVTYCKAALATSLPSHLWRTAGATILKCGQNTYAIWTFAQNTVVIRGPGIEMAGSGISFQGAGISDTVVTRKETFMKALSEIAYRIVRVRS